MNRRKASDGHNQRRAAVPPRSSVALQRLNTRDNPWSHSLPILETPASKNNTAAPEMTTSPLGSGQAMSDGAQRFHFHAR